jgi:hypothetical protein
MFKIARGAPAPGSKPRYVVFRHRQQYVYISSKIRYNETRRMSKMQDGSATQEPLEHTHTARRHGKQGNPGLTGPPSGRVALIKEEGARFERRCSVTSRPGCSSTHQLKRLEYRVSTDSRVCDACAQRSSLIYSISCTRANQSRLVAQAT